MYERLEARGKGGGRGGSRIRTLRAAEFGSLFFFLFLLVWFNGFRYVVKRSERNPERRAASEGRKRNPPQKADVVQLAAPRPSGGSPCVRSCFKNADFQKHGKRRKKKAEVGGHPASRLARVLFCGVFCLFLNNADDNFMIKNAFPSPHPPPPLFSLFFK